MACATGKNDRIAHDVLPDLSVTFPTHLHEKHAHAMRSLRAALRYADTPLIRSSIEEAVAAIDEVVDEAVRSGIRVSREVRETYTDFLSNCGGSPGEEFDAIGRAIDSRLGRVADLLNRTLDQVVADFESGGNTLPSAAQLREEIASVKEFKEAVIGSWPWSHLPLPASDHAILARSRAQSEKREGTLLADVIRQVRAAV